jgi:hypothetical protein
MMQAAQTITQQLPAVVRQDKTTVSIFGHIKAQLAAIPPIPSTISDHPQAAALKSLETAATDPYQLCSRTQSTNASTQTPATSILLTTTLFFLSKVHVAPSLPVQDELELLWDECIRARLRACLVHEITRGTCVQELMMAGRRADHLKPTIVVTCGDMKTRKRVQKVFKRQEWLQKLLKASGMLFVAAVEPTHLSSLNTTQKLGIGIGIAVGVGIPLALSLLMVWLILRRHAYHDRRETMTQIARPVRTESLAYQQDALAHSRQPAPFQLRVEQWRVEPRLHDLSADPLATNFPPQPSFCPPPPPTAIHQMPTPAIHMQEPVTSLAYEQNAATHKVMSCTLDSNQGLDTLCGQQLTITESANGDLLQCTLGGVLVVDGDMYGMTVGHVFSLDHPYPASASTSIITPEASQNEELDDSGCTIDTEEAFWFGLEGGAELSQQEISNPEHISTLMQHAEEVAAGNADKTSPAAASGPDQQFSGLHDVLNVFNKAVDQSDWALLHLPRTLSPSNNLKDPRNPWFKTVIVGIADDYAQGDVSVLFRDRSFSGVLRKSISTFLTEGRAYDVQLIVLNDMLRK